jgi:3-oxoacyl-[acyl-carrier protein] reductase
MLMLPEDDVLAAVPYLRRKALSGKKILVTGGSRGIGKATVLALARSGASVAFTYSSNEAAAEAVVAEATSTAGHVIALRADVEDFQQARQVVEKAREALGDLDGLVLNAGITRDGVFAMMPEENWDKVIATNLKGVFNYARAAIYGMIRQRSGRVVCVSSVSGGQLGVAGQTNYGATKAAQIGFVKALSKEVSAYGITVNAVAPGFIETDIWQSIPEAKRNGLLKTIPLGRLGQPDEVAAAICFLLSEQASYITGTVLTIDGGLSA